MREDGVGRVEEALVTNGFRWSLLFFALTNKTGVPPRRDMAAAGCRPAMLEAGKAIPTPNKQEQIRSGDRNHRIGKGRKNPEKVFRRMSFIVRKRMLSELWPVPSTHASE
jgi:hypothetical protein